MNFTTKYSINTPLPPMKDLIVDLSLDLPACKIDSIKDDIASTDDIYDENERLETISNICGYKNISHPQWGKLSGRIKMTWLVRNTPSTFFETTKTLETILDRKYFDFCMRHHEILQSFIEEQRDWVFDKFAMETLVKGYLLKFQGKTVERPSYLYLRVATYLYMDDRNEYIEKSLDDIKKCYNSISEHYISHASPTQFNAGMKRSQLASCFLLNAEDDMRSLAKSWHDTAVISMNNGGIGLAYDSIRHSEIGHQGKSRGIVPWIKIQNEILSTVDQCFAPETIIYTDMGPRKIEDINTGDKVLGKDGFHREVFKSIHHTLKETDKVYELDIKQSITPVIVTDKHPIYVIKCPKGQGFSKIISGQLVPEFVNVEELSDQYLIGTPVPVYEKDFGNFNIDDCRMYGIMIGDGHITEKKSECGVCLNSDTKSDTIKFVKKYLSERLIHSWVTEQAGKNTITIRWSSCVTFPITRTMLYNAETRSKKIFDKMLHLPLDKVAAMLHGIMETADGSFRNPNGEIYIELTSLNVIENLKYILLRTETLCGGYIRDRVGQTHDLPEDRGSITHKQKTYVLRIPKTKWVCDTLAMYSQVTHTPSNALSFIVDRGMMWSRINKLVESSKRPDVMIDLLMNRDNLEKIEDQEKIANYTTSIGLVHNGGRRPGSGTIYINDWHIDVFEFADLKKPTGNEEYRARDLTYGLMISDEFMRRVKAGEKWSLFCPAKTKHLEKTWGKDFEDQYAELEKLGKAGKIGLGYREVNARDLFNHIVNAQIETGMPFMIYKDAANRKSNQQNLGTIRLSNLCVHGDTLILTDQGQLRIGDLENQNVNVWNGDQWSNVTILKTNTNQNLLTVTLDNGSTLDCTPQHKFYIKTTGNSSSMVEAQNLSIGDTLIDCTIPSINIQNNGVAPEDSAAYNLGNGIVNITDIPTQSIYNTDFRLEWIAGFFDKWGFIDNDLNDGALYATHTNYVVLIRVRLLIQSLGVDASITTQTASRLQVGSVAANDFRLKINNYGVTQLQDLGLSLRKLRHIPGENNATSTTMNTDVKVLSVTIGPLNQDTFCFTVPINNMGVFNGILTGQCTEILEYTDENNIASCNLASIPLSKFVENRQFDFEKLGEVTRQTVRNLAQVIDRNYYPDDVPEIKYNNNKNRPIGIGVQDLAGCFALMDYSWTSDEAIKLNEKIARVMYYHAMDENVKMAVEYGFYDNFPGSPSSKGLFQFDLWDLEKLGKDRYNDSNYYFSNKYSKDDLKLPCKDFDWESLRTRMKTSGIYFSLMFAQMPTASTAQILSNNESIEPYTQMMYTRTVTSGCYSICVEHFVNDMEDIGLWDDKTLKHLLVNKGSITNLPEDDLEPHIKFRLKVIKRKYKTAYELSQKDLANLYLSRARYQCQTTSNNLFMSNPNSKKITAFHFHTWRGGAKTGMYYLKQTAKTDAINFSLDNIGVTNSKQANEECISCGA